MPLKSPRVFIKKGIGRMEFFEILNHREVDYVLLRWWENLPDIPDGEDLDILIRDEHRRKLNDLLTFNDNGTGNKCDIYTLCGSKYGSHMGLPYFQYHLGATLLKTRVMYRGAFVPAPEPYFASLAYHAVFHKGKNSGLQGFGKVVVPVEHEYPKILADQAQKLNINIDIAVTPLYNWLKERQFAPAEDTLTKLVEIRPELSFLQEPLSSDIRGGDLIVYVVRERIVRDGLVDDFINYLSKQYLFDVIDVRLLDANEKKKCFGFIRGGKWDRGPYKYSGGAPVALVVVFDQYPNPLSREESEKQPRVTNINNIKAKYEYREKVHAMRLNKGNYNGIHSSDNELDAWYYISLVGEEYRKKILNAVEEKRIMRDVRRNVLEK